MAIGLSSAPSFAATLYVFDGQLMGAAGVDVGGTLYDVTFREGTCIALFDGCDEASDFTFTTQEDAQAASQALLGQVFIDGPAGNFGSSPELRFGFLGLFPSTYVMTPYGFTLPDGSIDVVGVTAAWLDDSSSLLFLNPFLPGSSFPSTNNLFVYSDWTVATVPLPAGGMLLLSALGGMAALRRRRKSIV